MISNVRCVVMSLTSSQLPHMGLSIINSLCCYITEHATLATTN